MYRMGYSNYLQVFAANEGTGLNADAINKLTAARNEFVKRGEGKELPERVAISKEILDKYNLNSLVEVFNVDFTDLKDGIGEVIRGSLEVSDTDERVVEAAQDFSIRNG